MDWEERDKKVRLMLCLGWLSIISMLGVVAAILLLGWGEALANQLTAAYAPLYFMYARLWFHLYRDTEL